MKKIIVIGVLLICAGCATTSQQRLQLIKTYIDRGQELADELSDKAIILKDLAAKAETILADPNLALPEREKLREIAHKTSEQLTATLAKKTEVENAVKRWELMLDGQLAGSPDLSDELVLYGQGLELLGPSTGPAAGYLALAGTILAAIGGISGLVIKNSRTKQILIDVVASVAKLLANNNIVPDKKAATDILGEEQEYSTREVVDRIVDELATEPSTK